MRRSQKSGDPKPPSLWGFNAVTHRAGATLDCEGARSRKLTETVNVAFFVLAGGGRAEILVDGKSSGASRSRRSGGTRTFRTVLRGSPDSGDGKFHEVAVRSLSDGPVAVTDVRLRGRGGESEISYISFGFPGATVQLLDRLSSRNLADDLSRICAGCHRARFWHQ